MEYQWNETVYQWKGQKTTISISSTSCEVPISFLPKIWFQLSFWLTFVLKRCLLLHNLYCSFPLVSSCCSLILPLKFFSFFQSLNLLFIMVYVRFTELFLNLLHIMTLLTRNCLTYANIFKNFDHARCKLGVLGMLGILYRFKSCSRRVRDLIWWKTLAMVTTGNKA